MFTMESTQTVLRVAMSAELGNIDAACNEACGFLDRLGLEHCQFVVVLGLREALANAVVHGAKFDAGQIIRAELEYGRDGVAVTVSDEGPGFDWANAGRAVPHPLSMGGRGLPILYGYFDAVSFNARGNCIWFATHGGSNVVSQSPDCADGEAAIVMPCRGVESSGAGDLRQELQDLLHAGVTDITIDMSGVSVVDSTGIRLFIAAHNALAAAGGGLRLRRVSQDMTTLFGAMRLDMHFRVDPE